MELHEAIELINDAGILHDQKTTWADLGCGTGLFTRALCSMLAAGSTVHAVDKNAAALQKISSASSVMIRKVVADFIKDEMNFQHLDGLLMANSLHFVRDKISFLQKIQKHLKRDGVYLIIEYDTDKPNPWVPYPISFFSLQKLYGEFGDYFVHKIHEMPSRYNRANIYSTLIGPAY